MDRAVAGPLAHGANDHGIFQQFGLQSVAVSSGMLLGGDGFRVSRSYFCRQVVRLFERFRSSCG